MMAKPAMMMATLKMILINRNTFTHHFSGLNMLESELELELELFELFELLLSHSFSYDPLLI